MKKHTMLVTFNCVLEIEEPDSSNGDFDPYVAARPIVHKLEVELEAQLGPQPAHLGVVSMSLWDLDWAGSNSALCAKCGAWTTDCEKPMPVEGIQHGATVGGRLLCDSCLPEDHPEAF